MTEDDGSSGESLYLRGDYEEAVAAWERSEKGTEGFEHHYWKGVALRKLGRKEAIYLMAMYFVFVILRSYLFPVDF